MTPFNMIGIVKENFIYNNKYCYKVKTDAGIYKFTQEELLRSKD